mmetsp:Transcript_62195/g.148315  ORF Transcript_62195/g.148315 Transcript_62195/m.148315 type:complete len:212 (-) Transcript_62195:438-1073(-)
MGWIRNKRILKRVRGLKCRRCLRQFLVQGEVDETHGLLRQVRSKTLERRIDEERLGMVAGLAADAGHVPHNQQGIDFHLREELQAFVDIGQTDRVGCRDQNSTIHRQGLRNGQQNVTSTWRAVDDEDVQLPPLDCRQQLRDDLIGDRSPNRVGDTRVHIAPGHKGHTTVVDGDDATGLVLRHTIGWQPNKLGKRRAIDIQIEKCYLEAHLS